MISIWKPKTYYFIKLPVEKLLERLDVMLVDIMGYDPETEWVLEDVARGVKYLANNEMAIGIQINSATSTRDTKRLGINTRGVDKYITSQFFDLAKYMLQVDKFLTEDEYLKLESIEN
jgi:hypothetical protein